MQTTLTTSRQSGQAALLVGLVALSTSGPFFVMAEMSAYAAALWRTTIGGLLALSLAALRGALSLRALRANARGVVWGGILMGPHLLLWIKAFELTDYASNLLLVVAQPLSSALIGRLLGESLPRGIGLSLALAVVGMACVAGADLTLGPTALLGDFFCILTGVLGALFYVVARRARVALPLDVYMGATLSVAALTVLPVALLADVPLVSYPSRSWLWLAGIVLASTLGGHGLLNHAARALPLVTVNLAILLEPVIGLGLGALLFGARVGAAQLVGGALLVLAVARMLTAPRPTEPVSACSSEPVG